MLEDYFFTKNTKWFFWGLAALLVAFLIFHAGFVVGRDSMRPHGRPMFVGFVDRGHGAIGVVSGVSGNTITLTEPDGDTETVTFASTTPIRFNDGTSTLKIGQHIIIVGAPDETHETIQAKFIRIAP